jgi:hypothetical protein
MLRQSHFLRKQNFQQQNTTLKKKLFTFNSSSTFALVLPKRTRDPSTTALQKLCRADNSDTATINFFSTATFRSVYLKQIKSNKPQTKKHKFPLQLQSRLEVFIQNLLGRRVFANGSVFAPQMNVGHAESARKIQTAQNLIAT